MSKKEDMDLSVFQKAREAIFPYIKKTPLVRCYELESLHNSRIRIFLKCENLQLTHCFKARGAFNALLNLSEQDKKRGVVTRSSGNFGASLAYAAKILGIPVTIVMPKNVTKKKHDQAASFSPTIVLASSRKEEEEMVRKISSERGLQMLSPYNHLDVIAGQGTISLEIYEQLPTVKYLICPLGGGGLMGGTAAAIKKLNPSSRTIAIEPLGADDYFLSRKEKRKVHLDVVDTIADGLRAPEVGSLTYPLLEKYVDTVEVVPDVAIKQAMRFLYEKVGMIVEPSGAASVAGAMFHPGLDLHGDVVCIISGGNVDLDKFYPWIEEAASK
jgi:threonine dehydratase